MNFRTVLGFPPSKVALLPQHVSGKFVGRMFGVARWALLVQLQNKWWWWWWWWWRHLVTDPHELRRPGSKCELSEMDDSNANFGEQSCIKGSITEDGWDTWRYPSERRNEDDYQKSEISSFACYLLSSKNRSLLGSPAEQPHSELRVPTRSRKKRKDLYLRSLKTAAFEMLWTWTKILRGQGKLITPWIFLTGELKSTNVWRSTPL